MSKPDFEEMHEAWSCAEPIEDEQAIPDDGQSVEQPKDSINVFRFLQLKPQNSGIAALLVFKYRNEIKTVESWEGILHELLITKTK